MRARSRIFLAIVLLSVLILMGQIALAESDQAPYVITVEHRIPHRSTVPANMGQTIELSVREVVASNREVREAVLMIHGLSVPALAGFDLRTDLGSGKYSFAHSLAQAGGIDVFILDFQGSGRSPFPERDIRHQDARVMDDPCNVPTADQTRALIPNPLSTTCPPAYPYQLNTAQSDWDELDTVVDYIRNLRGLAKVHLIAWSQGSFRAGPYAAKDSEKPVSKIASVFFYAPIFNSQPGPANRDDPPSVIPQSGTPMSLRTRAQLFGLWRPEVRCENQREEGIEDVVWSAIMDNDTIGRTWGPPPAGASAASAPEGVMRVRTVTLWGWNTNMARRLNVPTAIFQGEFDTGGGGPQHLAQLYSFIPHPNKLRFRVQCTGHQTVWENQRRVLHHVAKEWIRHRQVGGFDQGQFFIDTEGNTTPLAE